jgi:hypothetical protein
MMKRLLLWLVMRAYRLRHFRVSGHLNERVFASGDMLLTGSAQRVLFSVLHHQGDDVNAGFTIKPVSGELLGARPPRVLEAASGRPIYREREE